MWDFNNDGFVDSNEQNPVYIFNQVGTYDVSLTITDGINEDTELKMNYITVTDTTSVYNSLNLKQTQLFQNYPNPFNPITTISFSLNDDTGKKVMVIYNLKGQKIREYPLLTNQSSIIWNGTDENGKPVSSGIYFYKLKTDTKSYTHKMILLK